MVDCTCHDHKFTLLNIFGKFVSAVGEHLCFQKPLCENLKDRFFARESNIIHALGVVEAEPRPLPSSQDHHGNLPLRNQLQSFFMVSFVVILRHTLSINGQFLLNPLKITFHVSLFLRVLYQIFIELADDIGVKRLHLV